MFGTALQVLVCKSAITASMIFGLTDNDFKVEAMISNGLGVGGAGDAGADDAITSDFLYLRACNMRL